MAQPTYTKVVGPITINCNDDWTPCQREQACSKIRRMNTRARNAGPGGLKNISKTSNRDRIRYDINRDAGNRFAANYDGANYAHPCMTAGGAVNAGRPMNADHIHEIQFKGGPAGPFMWLDAAVNKSIGTQLNKTGNVTHLTGVKAANCAPEC